MGEKLGILVGPKSHRLHLKTWRPNWEFWVTQNKITRRVMQWDRNLDFVDLKAKEV